MWPTVAEIANRFHLPMNVVNRVADTSGNVFVREQIGGRAVCVLNVDAFVREVRTARGKPMWKR